MRELTMIRRRSVSVAACAASAMLLGVTGCTDIPPGVIEPQAKTDIFAYATSTELIVADGTTTVSRTPGAFDTTRDVGLTKDAKFAFWKEDSRNGDGPVVAAVSTGAHATAIRVPCGCRQVLPFSGSTIVWLQAPGTVMRMDLAAAQPKPAVWRTITPAPQAQQHIDILAIEQDRLLLNRYDIEQQYDSIKSQLFTIEANGETRTRGPLSDIKAYFYSGAFSPDGQSAALSQYAVPSSYVRDMACSQAVIYFLDLTTDALRPTVPAPENCSSALKLRWDTPDGPTIAVDRWPAFSAPAGAQTTRWQRRQGTWSPLDPPIADRAKTWAGATIELAKPGSADYYDVYFIKNDQRTRIAEQVYSIAVP
ncbi:hypothetical protein ACIA8C_05945 [Nocardia sp. NPDC051321]|uniref:hypothetical protein n=1 Tax=Nocardia sp. NPDC051321 TaxID=3364323 RepID=UPI00379C390C